MRVVCVLLILFWIVLIVRILSSWFPPPRSPGARRAYELLYTITEPVLRPLRGMLPPLRLGAVALDLSPIIVFIAIGILQRVLCR